MDQLGILGSNQQPQMNNADEEWYSSYIHGAVGPYSSDLQMYVDGGDVTIGAYHYKAIGARTYCDDDCGDRWIIVVPTHTTTAGALGPFDLNQLVVDNLGVVTGIVLEDRVESIALGTLCFDTSGCYWMIYGTLTNHSNEGHSPATPTDSHTSELVQEDVYEASAVDVIEGGLVDSDDQAIMEPTPDPGDLFDRVHGEFEAAAAGMDTAVVRGDEGLRSPPVNIVDGLETPHFGIYVVPAEQGAHLLAAGESQSEDPSYEDFCAVFLREVDEVVPWPGSQFAGDGADRGAVQILPTSHEATATRMEIAVCGEEALAPVMNGDTPVLEHSPGVSRSVTPPHLSSAGESEAQTAREKVFGAARTAAKRGGNRKPGGKPARKRARRQSPSPVLNIVGGGATGQAPVVVPTSLANEAAVPEIVTDSNHGNEALAPPVHGEIFLLDPPESDAAVLEQGACSSGESQSVISVENIMVSSQDSEMQGQTAGEMGGGTAATASSGRRGRQATRRRPRQPTFKYHGVQQRAGCRQSFVAYFRPKGLPEDDKTFATVGEFTNEQDAWNAFNLFALVHEGEEACINANIGSIAVEAEMWRNFPRVELLAHLRLKGRGYHSSAKLKLPPDSQIPRFRNVKVIMAAVQGNLKWFCDVSLGTEVTDPNVANGTKNACTYGTGEEAAREADRKMMLKEGNMAWTNYSLTDYMTDEEKEQWDNTWIPLQANHRKYLSAQKY